MLNLIYFSLILSMLNLMALLVDVSTLVGLKENRSAIADSSLLG